MVPLYQMHTLLSTLKGITVLSNETKERLGVFNSVLINPKTMNIEGIYIAVPTFFASTLRFVPICEVVRLSTVLLVRSEDSVTEDSEIFRLQPLLEAKERIVRAKVFTESGTYKGKVYDVQLHTNSFTVVQIVVKRLFGSSFYYSVHQIHRVGPKGIIIKDTVEKVPEEPAVPSELSLPVLQET